MVNSAINRIVGGQQEASGINRTVEASNTGGSISPNYEAEELEELESRGITKPTDKLIPIRSKVIQRTIRLYP